MLLAPDTKPKAGEDYSAALVSLLTRDQGQPEPYLISYVDSGMVSNRAYGARVRAVTMTRGGRQGNNAFLEYADRDPLTTRDL